MRYLTVTGVQTCALPISTAARRRSGSRTRVRSVRGGPSGAGGNRTGRDRKSTRLNSSHSQISYAVFCLKKKKQYIIIDKDTTAMLRTSMPQTLHMNVNFS